MASNGNLRKAGGAHNDEFYTQLKDIAAELTNYKSFFKDKVILCNCDDPLESNFWRYFHQYFSDFGLKKLIATHYEANDKTHSYYWTYEGGDDSSFGNNIMDATHNRFWPLKGNGDFRSAECIELLKEADIVATNPPFSLFREYIAQLMEYHKYFVVIGNLNAASYKEIFPLIKANKMWAGYSFNKTFEFIMPDSYEIKGKGFIDRDGKKHGFVPAVAWYTNIPIKKRSEKLIDTLTKSYAKNVSDYPMYDNYPAIEVSRTKDIPYDYYDLMGVPITFLDKFNPNEFEILGVFNNFKPETCGDAQIYGEAVSVESTSSLYRGPVINGKPTYIRVIIKRKYKDEAGTIPNT